MSPNLQERFLVRVYRDILSPQRMVYLTYRNVCTLETLSFYHLYYSQQKSHLWHPKWLQRAVTIIVAVVVVVVVESTI